jgi:hypothetical protein
MSAFLHRLAHLLGMNTGTIAFAEDEGRRAVGFRCDGCGLVVGGYWSLGWDDEHRCPLFGPDLTPEEAATLTWTDPIGRAL